MDFLAFASLVLMAAGLFYLNDTRPDFHRGSRGSLAVGALCLSVLVFMRFGVVPAVLVLAISAALAAWRIRR